MRGIDDDGAGRLIGAIVDDLAAQVTAQVAPVILGVGVGRRGHRLLLRLRAEQRLERIERVGGSRGGRQCARREEDRDRGDGLQTAKIVHDTSPLTTIGRSGGCPGSKCLPTINPQGWLPAAR